MILKRKVTQAEFPKAYLTVMNGYFGLTGKELDVMSSILGKMATLEVAVTDPLLLNKFLFSIDTRKEMATEVGISFQNLNSMIKQLLKKRVLVLDDNDIPTPIAALRLSMSTTFNFEIITDETRRDSTDGDIQDSSREEQPDSSASGASPQVDVQEGKPIDEGLKEVSVKINREDSSSGDLLHTDSKVGEA